MLTAADHLAIRECVEFKLTRCQEMVTRSKGVQRKLYEEEVAKLTGLLSRMAQPEDAQ